MLKGKNRPFAHMPTKATKHVVHFERGSSVKIPTISEIRRRTVDPASLGISSNEI